MRKLAVLIALCFPVTAHAGSWDGHRGRYTDQHRAPADLTALAKGPARQFWAARGVNTCASITVYQSAAVGSIGWAAGGYCAVWLSDDLVARTTWERQVTGDALVDVCQAITHEVGHALGLSHSATGVMAASGQPALPHGWAPWFCWRWADREMEKVLMAHGWTRKRARYRLNPVWSPG